MFSNLIAKTFLFMLNFIIHLFAFNFYKSLKLNAMVIESNLKRGSNDLFSTLTLPHFQTSFRSIFFLSFSLAFKTFVVN